MLIEEGEYYINGAGFPVGPMAPVDTEVAAVLGYLKEFKWRDQHGYLYKDNGECYASPLMNLTQEDPTPLLYRANLSPVVTPGQLTRSAELRQLRNELAAGIFRDRVSDGRDNNRRARAAIEAANAFVEELGKEGQ